MEHCCPHVKNESNLWYCYDDHTFSCEKCSVDYHYRHSFEAISEYANKMFEEEGDWKDNLDIQFKAVINQINTQYSDMLSQVNNTYAIRKDYIQKLNKSKELFKKKVYYESILLLEASKSHLEKDSSLHTNMNIMSHMIKMFGELGNILSKFQDIPLKNEMVIIEKIGKFSAFFKDITEAKSGKFDEIKWGQVESLMLQSKNVSDKEIAEITHSIKRSHLIKEINMSYNAITFKGVESLVAVLPSKLSYLNLMSNNIANEGVKLLVNAIPYIETLNISNL